MNTQLKPDKYLRIPFPSLCSTWQHHGFSVPKPSPKSDHKYLAKVPAETESPEISVILC